MKGFDLLKVKSAVKARNSFDLSFDHLTTMDFGQIVPLGSWETVPGDEFNINSNFFSRLAPLVVPTYGKFQFKTVAGYVPYHQIADDADPWIAGKSTADGSTCLPRYFTASDLVTFLSTYCTTTTNATATNCDYSCLNSSGVAVYRLFTSVGRFYFKVLNSLGYCIPQGVDFQTDSDWLTSGQYVKYNAYPLLAFFKLYNDYMSQSQRYNSSSLSTFLNAVKHGKSATGWTYTTGLITNSGLYILFSNLKLNYENDYFTSAWQNPSVPLSSYEESESTVYVPGSTAGGDMYVQRNGVDNYLQTASGQIGQRALDFLRSYDDWVRRNNYSGSRSVQQVYSRFGIKVDDYRSNYAHVLKTDSMPIQVGDVTATAASSYNSEEIALGDYAGKGIMNGASGIQFKADDYGMLFILGYFTVSPMMAYGFDRSVLRTSPLDFYTPEFDGIGGDAISLGEVYSSPISYVDNGDDTLDTAVFGFTERYNSYRYGRDRITGEFRDYHSDGDMNAWHSGRNLTQVRLDAELVAQASSVNTLPQYASEYDRIFSAGTDGSIDHFYLTCRFNVNAIRPMLNLNQVVKLGEGDTVVPRNGNVIS